jgi:hypothetical protein
MDAQAAKAKTRNSGPGGCQSWASETSEPPTATTAVAGTASQARCGDSPTTTPAVVAAVRSTVSVSCIRVRERWTWLRP